MLKNPSNLKKDYSILFQSFWSYIKSDALLCTTYISLNIASMSTIFNKIIYKTSKGKIRKKIIKIPQKRNKSRMKLLAASNKVK